MISVGRTAGACSLAILLALYGQAAGAAEPGAKTVTVVAKDYQFEPARLVFRRGVAYRLHLENHGSELHEFHAAQFFKSAEIQNPAVLNADKTEVDLQPGDKKDLYLVPRQAGHFRLYCPDHDWAGMIGKITVK